MRNHSAIKYSCEGDFIHLENTRAFVYEKGKGEPVLCFHGVPATSYLYRNVINELAKNGYRGISFDLLGMGLSDRPENFEYNWTNLGVWALEVIQKMNLGKFHVILHDIGGPIGCEVIAKIPEQIASVTILNTPLTNLEQFKKPFPMFLYEKKGIGELIVRLTNAFFFKQLMYSRGVNKKEKFGTEEARAYVNFLNGNDKGKAFLKIMRSFETTKEKEQLYINALNGLSIPKQIIWGVNDKALTLEKYGIPLKEALGIKEIIELPGYHFLQEDYSKEIVENIVELNK